MNRMLVKLKGLQMNKPNSKTDMHDRLTTLEQWVKKLSTEVAELRQALTSANALPAKPKWDLSGLRTATRERWDNFRAQHNEQDINEALKVLNFVWQKWEQANVFCKHVIIHESDIPTFVIKGVSWTFQDLVQSIFHKFALTYDSKRKWYVMYENKV